MNCEELAGPRRARGRCRRSTATSRNGTFADVTARLRARRRAVRHRRRGGRLRQRRPAPTSTSPRSAAIACSGTSAAASSPTSRQRPASPTAASRRARCGSTTTTTAGSICSSRTTSSGRSRRICTARSTARPSRTARRSRTRARARRSSTTAATAPSRTSPSRPGSTTRRRRGSAWRCSTTTATAGWTCSSPTTPSRTGSIATSGNGTFEDVAVGAGVAFSEAGVARAGMGVDAADYDGSGRPSLIIGNFSNEMMALYHNEGNGLFIDDAPRSAIGRASLLTLTFGCFFFDYDLDGRARHLRRQRPRRRRHRAGADRASPTRSGRTCSATPAGEQFEDVTAAAGTGAARSRWWRAAPPTATIDNDGDLDLLINVNNGPARLLRNDGGAATTCCGCRRSAPPRIATASARASRSRSRGGAEAVADRQDRVELRCRRASCR